MGRREARLVVALWVVAACVVATVWVISADEDQSGASGPRSSVPRSSVPRSSSTTVTGLSTVPEPFDLGASGPGTIPNLGSSDPEEFDPRFQPLDPSGSPNEVRLCSAIGGANVTMPVRVVFDGPRTSASILDAREETYAVGFSDARQIRYEAFVIYGLEGRKLDAEGLLRAVIDGGINENPGHVVADRATVSGSHVEADWVERWDGRVYRGRAWAAKGAVFYVAVATYQEGAETGMNEKADRLLNKMIASVDFPGLDRADEPCTEPSQTAD